MGVESKLSIIINSSLTGKGFDDATSATSRLKKATNSLSINSGIKTLEKEVYSLIYPFNALQVAIVAAVGSASKIISVADSYKLIEGRLSLVTENTKELVSAQQSLFSVSQDTRQTYTDTADLYTRIAKSTQNLNKTQKENLTVIEGINKALIISGSSRESSNAALVQLGQGFASGTLRGEELNSVIEQTPRVSQAVADGMGVTIGELRNLGEQGKLTAEAVFDALLSQQKVLNEEFSKMPLTVGQSVTLTSNSFQLLIGKMDEATGATAALSAEIKSFSQFLDQNSTELIATWQFVYATGSRTIDVFNLVYETIENITQRVVGYVNLTVYGSLEVILTMLTKVTEGLNTIGLASDKGLKEAYADLESVHQLVISSNNMIAESYTDLDAAIEKLSPTIEDRIKEYNRLKQAAIEAKSSESDILKKDLPDRFTRSTALDDKYWENLYDQQKSSYDKSVQDAKKAIQDKKKLEDDYYDYIADLAKSSTEDKVDQEILAEAYKYQKFLDEHKLNLEQKTALEKAFTGTIERIQLDGQKESLKKQQDALLEYYKSVGNTTAAAEIELAKYKESINDLSLGDMQKKEMIATMEKDLEREKLLKQLDFNEEYYKAVGDMANANAIAQEKYALQLEKQGYSKDKIAKMAYGSNSQKSNYDTMYSSVGIDTGLAGQMQDRLKSIDTFQETERKRIEAYYALLEQNNENHQAKMAEIDQMQFSSRLATASTGFSSLASLSKMFYDASDGQNKVALRTYQAFSVAQAMINTYTAASKALATGGPYMGPAMAAIAVAQGMAQVAMIKAQKYHSGGFVTGTTDEVPAILQREEGVLSRKGMKNLDALNLGTASSSSSGSQQITIVNSIDPAIMEQYVTSRSGRKVIKNIMNGS